jgi:hypothetical protein
VGQFGEGRRRREVGLIGLQFLNTATWRSLGRGCGAMSVPQRKRVLDGQQRGLVRYGTWYDEGPVAWLGHERLARLGRTLAVGDTTG